MSKKILKKVLDKVLYRIFKVISKIIKTDEKIILFIAYHGKGYMCNPKYIHKYMLKDQRLEEYQLVWAIRDLDEEIEGARKIKYGSFKYFYMLFKSKYWISNCKLPSYYVKKNNQIYIQTWHGTPLKRLAHDIECKENTTFYRSEITKEDMVKTYDEDSKKYDYFISPNRYSTEIFKRCFKIKEEIIREVGYPRNEILRNYTQNDVDKIKNEFKIKADKKIILYTPTWRDNQFDLKGYKMNLQVDFIKWKKVLGEEWIILFKPHYLIETKFKFEELQEFVYVINEGYDIANLYIISDVLITDYSSTFFDYAILDRPIIFYMYDKEEYENELRGFYIEAENLPGPIFEKEEEMIWYIKDLKDKKNNKRKDFLQVIKDSDEYKLSSKTIIEEIILGVER